MPLCVQKKKRKSKIKNDFVASCWSVAGSVAGTWKIEGELTFVTTHSTFGVFTWRSVRDTQLVPVPFDLSLWALLGECWNRSFALRPPRSYQQADDVGFTKTQVRGRRQWINCAASETLFPVNISIQVGGGLNMLNSCLAEVLWKSALLPLVNVVLDFSH